MAERASRLAPSPSTELKTYSEAERMNFCGFQSITMHDREESLRRGCPLRNKGFVFIIIKGCDGEVLQLSYVVLE